MSIRSRGIGSRTSGVLNSFTIVENHPGASVMEVLFTAGPGQSLALRCELKAGQPFLSSEARPGMTGWRVEALLAMFAGLFVVNHAFQRTELPGEIVEALERTYAALVRGAPQSRTGRIVLPNGSGSEPRKNSPRSVSPRSAAGSRTVSSRPWRAVPAAPGGATAK